MLDNITWAAVGLALGPALLVALSTILATWLSNRFQLQAKQIELSSQSKLRARELLFNAYQQDLERIGVEAQKQWEVLGRGIAQVLAAENEDEKQKSLEAFLTLLRRLDLDMKDSIDAVEAQLKEADMLDEAKKDILFLREHLMVDPQTLTTYELEKLMFKLIKAQSIETKISRSLINYRRDKLFSPYLKD